MFAREFNNPLLSLPKNFSLCGKITRGNGLRGITNVPDKNEQQTSFNFSNTYSHWRQLVSFDKTKHQSKVFHKKDPAYFDPISGNPDPLL
jgi:hypothetical protein